MEGRCRVQEVIQVDAFTKEPFKGNPAAVCIMAGPADEAWMQKVAMEMNLSETAFVHPLDNGFSLRWFTPGAEVQLCGHATLASAHVLFEDKHVAADDTIEFQTKYSGKLYVKRDSGRLQMDLPVLPVVETKIPEGFGEAMNLTAIAAGAAQSDDTLMVEVDSAEGLAKCSPNFDYLSRLDYLGICVTAKAEGEYDFYSRSFAPKLRINEDPATGSAHCVLVDYWSRKLGKDEFHAFQASQRGGIFHLRKEGDRCLIGGDAVTTMRGKLTV